jgi:hypothetical protein
MKYLSFILFIGFASCQFSSSKQPATITTTRDTTVVPDINTARLLKLYKTISADTVEIGTSPDDNITTWKYNGTLIDTSLLALLPQDYGNRDPLFYACYQFNLDTNTIGLITRTPSEYESSSIKLFAYHKKTNTITFETELSDAWGDAGDAVYKNSWLYRNAGKGWIGIIEQYNYNEDIEDTTVPISETYDYYHFRWNGSRIDTVSTDSSALVEIYKQISPGAKKTTLLRNPL